MSVHNRIIVDIGAVPRTELAAEAGLRHSPSEVASPPCRAMAVALTSVSVSNRILRTVSMSLMRGSPALVVDNVEDFHARIDDPDLDVDADTVLVLRGCGPKGYLGMPEVSNMPPAEEATHAGRPRHDTHLRRGRVSGTAYGTVVLHVAPEAAAGGTARIGAGGGRDHPGRTQPNVDAGDVGGGAAAPPTQRRTLAGFANPVRGWERHYIDTYSWPIRARTTTYLSAPHGQADQGPRPGRMTNARLSK